MSAIPYALSVHHFVSTVGSYAGFAAIVGLALVVLLFFGHARETRALRERAEDAEDALHRLELYVDQVARAAAAAPAPAPASASAFGHTAVTPPPNSARIAAVRSGPAAPVAGNPFPVSTAATTGASSGVTTVVPAAPAGVGAPALSAATRLIPALAPAPGTASAVMDPPAPPPATAAGGGNGGSVVAPPSGAPAGRLPLRPAGARPGAPAPPSRRQRGGGGRSGVGRGALALATVLVIVAVVVALLVVTSSGGGGNNAQTKTQAHHSSTTARTTRHKKATATTAAVSPSAVTVAVLNGTSTTNLAHDISQKLSTVGYKAGNIATATDQTETATVVGYLPGFKSDALSVAKSLKLGTSSVQAVDASNRTLACNGSSTSCTAQVVVTVGSDLASSA